MEGSDIWIMIASMFASFLLGMLGMLFFSGRTILNYLKVRASRGKRVLIFTRNNFGWGTATGKKVEKTVEWKRDGNKLITTIERGDVIRYMKVEAIFADSDSAAVALKSDKDGLYPNDFDAVVYNNLLIRALTRPNADGDDLKTMRILMAVLFLTLISAVGVVVVYFALSNLDLCPVCNTMVGVIG